MAFDQNDPRVQEYLHQEKNAARSAKGGAGEGGSGTSKGRQNSSKMPNAGEKESRPTKVRKQHGPFKKKRAGIVLTKDEVIAIKKGRRKLRREMRQRGIKGKRDFELTAGTLGLYFDKNSAFLAWLWSHWLGGLLAALALLLAVLFLFSLVTRARGFFTINLSDGMFREGFSLSETVGFENPSMQLFASPAQNVPCISINQIPTDIDETDGQYNAAFAYTFYLRNEGENTVGYDWSLTINSESQELTEGMWVMLFEDGQMRFYAKANRETGLEEALPAYGDDSRGYLILPIREAYPASDQFRLVKQVNGLNYYRVIPDKFLSDKLITSGGQRGVEPMEAHKYTVVLWIEGDDPDATNDLIGGHAGVEMNYRLVEEEQESDRRSGWSARWKELWDGLRFWKTWVES